MSNRLEIGITYEALEKAFNFALKFHLHPKKVQMNRTTGQTRGLGGEFDSFLSGKIIELGVAMIIEELNPKVRCNTDFVIHDKAPTDPDIIQVFSHGETRDPNVFIEIKNFGESDRWVGLTEEQLDTISNNPLTNDPNMIYIIYASIRNRGQASDSKKDDMLGTFLKHNFLKHNRLLEEFADLHDLRVEISQVLTANDLLNKGTRFRKEKDLFYETEIFTEVNPKHRDSSRLRKTMSTNPILPRFRYVKDRPYPKKIGDIRYEGQIVLYKKENEKSRRMYLYCLTDVLVSNPVLGQFNLDKGHMYSYEPKTVGRNPVCQKNNVWIAKRNVHNVASRTTYEFMKEIARTI